MRVLSLPKTKTGSARTAVDRLGKVSQLWYRVERKGGSRFRLSDLPTYDEAMSQFIATGASNCVNTTNIGSPIRTAAGPDSTTLLVTTNEIGTGIGFRSLHPSPKREQNNNVEVVTTSTPARMAESCSFEKEDSPPPTYGEALAMIRNRSVIGQAGQDDQAAESGVQRSAAPEGGTRLGGPLPDTNV